MAHSKMLAVLLGFGLVLTACGTGNIQDTTREDPNEQVQTGAPVNDSEWETIETISNRNIIAKLVNPAIETPERDQAVEKVKESREFQEGLFGEPTDDLAEELAVQQVEGAIAIPLLEKIYGGHDRFNNAGVLFYENKTRGAEQTGLWIGVKKPDERLKKFIDSLQEKVNAGEVKAEYIYIYHSPHTTAENNQKMDEAHKAARKLQEQHETPDRVSLGVSVDTITGDIKIEHNFLTEEQQESLKKQFPGETMVFEQTGRLAPIGGEPDTIYPKKEFTDHYSKEGAYVMELTEEGLLAVDAAPEDFGKSGGQNDFFSAIHFQFPDASKKLKVGQRVEVEPSGWIMESYPGQGTALYVEVLPEYKPAGANLSESQVIRKALEKNKNQMGVLAVREISYDADLDQWNVSLKQEDKEWEVKVKDL